MRGRGGPGLMATGRGACRARHLSGIVGLKQRRILAFLCAPPHFPPNNPFVSLVMEGRRPTTNTSSGSCAGSRLRQQSRVCRTLTVRDDPRSILSPAPGRWATTSCGRAEAEATSSESNTGASGHPPSPNALTVLSPKHDHRDCRATCCVPAATVPLLSPALALVLCLLGAPARTVATSITFTGNVSVDFPTGPGVFIATDSRTGACSDQLKIDWH
jgi:hypothetical protein